jgi:phosphocarrier protein HPr
LKRLELKISNRLGLHARAAARFVHLANEFQCRLQVRKENVHVDGKSILGLLTLAAAEGSVLELLAEGEDESEAVEALGQLVRDRFGETK